LMRPPHQMTRRVCKIKTFVHETMLDFLGQLCVFISILMKSYFAPFKTL
jgi:hypothetical protein